MPACMTQSNVVRRRARSLRRPGRTRLCTERGEQQSGRAERPEAERVEPLLQMRVCLRLLLGAEQLGGRVPHAHAGVVSPAHLAADWAKARRRRAAARPVDACCCRCREGRGSLRRERQVVLQRRRRGGLLQLRRALLRRETVAGAAAAAPHAPVA